VRCVFKIMGAVVLLFGRNDLFNAPMILVAPA
jgi:hypothetical protein